MKTFDVQSIEIARSYDEVFKFIQSPENLTKWAMAFKEIDGRNARLVTPKGELDIKLDVKSSKEYGTVDWYMTMPDGSIGVAFSRVVKDGEKSIYSFVLMAPPVALEEIEGALNAQIEQLKEELTTLKSLLENNDGR